MDILILQMEIPMLGNLMMDIYLGGANLHGKMENVISEIIIKIRKMDLEYLYGVSNL